MQTVGKFRNRNGPMSILLFTFVIQLLFAGDYCNAAKPAPHGGEKPHEGTKPPGETTPQGGTNGALVTVTAQQVVLDNGIVQVTFANPQGFILAIKYGGMDNVLDNTNKASDRGYWDIASMVRLDDDQSEELKLIGTSFKIISQTADKAEISFVFPRSPSVALKADMRYVIQKGSSGFYSYAIFERDQGWPALEIDQIRTVFKPHNKFTYMAVSDKIQREMPGGQDRDSGKPLEYKEAVLLTNPKDPKMKGEVDDKYQYALEDKDNKVHGWISHDPPVGVWVITPTDEFRMSGPHKQDLTSHTGPTMLAMFHSTHFAGKECGMPFKEGEPWKKVFGPYFLHVNSLPGKGNALTLWQKAKDQHLAEVKSWPYEFPISPDFAKANQRGSVAGRLQVNDGGKAPVPGANAMVGLAAPGVAGSWQNETKGYQFWVRADRDGKFLIPNVREGTYSLYAWVPGFIADFKAPTNVVITPGKQVNMGDVVYAAPRVGPTLWEIGIPDRSAAEFFAPDPSPNLANKLFLNDPENKYRQYGLWDRYSEIYPQKDIVYTVGKSDFHKDWYYAHVLRRTKAGYQPTTWSIVFPLKDVKPNSKYTLRIALAASSDAELQVRVNNADVNSRAIFSTGRIGRDNAIARHGIHGIYRVYAVDVPSSLLKPGDNTIFLTQSRGPEFYRGLMYDYIRLEGPA